jgi:osmotically inducible protein OsmC
MPDRKGEAQWEGTIGEGKGTMTAAGATLPYTRASRFENGDGSNPEELLAAAHAGCFSMAFSGQLTRAEFPPTSIHTTASVRIEKVDAGFKVTRITLDCEAVVPGIDEATFQEKAQAAKATCPISVALASVDEIVLNAKLKS